MLKKYVVNKTLGTDEYVDISVEFPDTDTEGSMVIVRADEEIFEISNEGRTRIGIAGELAGESINTTSIIFNLDQKHDWVRMNVLLNDEIIVQHENHKESDEHPTIKIRLIVETT